MFYFYSILTVGAYLIGSLSGAIILSKVLYGTDIRTLGSGNPGAANVQRNFGWMAGLGVLFFDFLKGVGAVSLVFFTKLKPETESFVSLQIVLGMAAIVGHIFPIYFKFKGGKGVAVVAGVLYAIHPWAMLICTGVFVVVLLCTKYISVSVLVAVTLYPVLIYLMFYLWLMPQETLSVRLFSIVIAVTIWITHISNIKRLKRGEEVKFNIKKPVKTLYDKSCQ